VAHEVESMMYVGNERWHGLGRGLPEGTQLNIREAIAAAGLDWEVQLRSVLTFAEGKGLVQIPDYFATYRTSDGLVPGIVGADYQPLQNRDAFRWFQTFLDAGEAVLETAGSLKKGRKVWILAKIKQDNIAIKKDDEVASYVLLSNSHDGSLSVRVGFTPIRVVCNNTLCLALESQASKLLRVKQPPAFWRTWT
jgi:phage/plasmid-like protein (TIGR03299 family)